MVNEPHRVLWCFIKDDHNAFKVIAPVDIDIDEVKELIWEKGKYGKLRGTDAKDLVLWKLKVPEPIKQPQDLIKPPPPQGLAERIVLRGDLSECAIELLDPSDIVLDWFPEEPQAKSIHIVVECHSVYAVTKGKRLPSSPHPEEPSLKLQRTNYFNNFPNDAPSTLAQPPVFSNVQNDPNTRMFCNRPRTANSTPITLLHPIFGQFVDDCKDHPLDPKMASFSLELATKMCKLHESKAVRAQAFRDFIWDRFTIKLEPTEVAGTGFKTDGHASVGFYVYVNTECKNEIGSTAADPSLQSAIYYHHHTNYSVGKVQNSRFPCLHVFCFGSFFGFAGSAFSDRVHYEPLTALIPLWFSPHDTEMHNTITRFFSALKNAASNLVTYYTELQAHTPTTFATAEEAQFPYPTTFTHLQTYVNTSLKLDRQPIPGKLLYCGSMETGELVVVKFVRSYSKDLHEYCASYGLAPALVGFEKLTGDWFMVVMEYENDYVAFSTVKNRASISKQLRETVTNLVTSFHAEHFVHGDIRDSNLLVRIGDGELGMKLVDFDWGGNEGEVRYPILINNHTVYRPPSVFGGQLITTEHDLLMVEDIFRGLP